MYKVLLIGLVLVFVMWLVFGLIISHETLFGYRYLLPLLWCGTKRVETGDKNMVNSELPLSGWLFCLLVL